MFLLSPVIDARQILKLEAIEAGLQQRETDTYRLVPQAPHIRPAFPHRLVPNLLGWRM
jgi:hypothetical protein